MNVRRRNACLNEDLKKACMHACMNEACREQGMEGVDVPIRRAMWSAVTRPP